MKFFYYIWRYDKRSTNSQRLSKPYSIWYQAESDKERLARNDPDGIFTVQENND